MTAESRLRLQVCPSDEVTLILFPAGLVLEDMGAVDGGLLEGFTTEDNGGGFEVCAILEEEGGDLDPEYFLLF